MFPSLVASCDNRFTLFDDIRLSPHTLSAVSGPQAAADRCSPSFRFVFCLHLSILICASCL